MSLHADLLSEKRDLQKNLIVFEGSSPEDVSHARQLWSSTYLQPPLESRLVSADIRQRLPVSRPQRANGGGSIPPQGPPTVFHLRQRQEERRRYEAMAERRNEIMALLRMQRERRMEKELLSASFRMKTKPRELELPGAVDSETEKELVRQLQ